ncbi:UDP-N-acetylmuramoyl-L-alanyl-D-glutamate--2,6-diaminopimelate ligase [Lactobacillus sp. 3B(2020)]|uniref:UDP-N-acetylmuramoyl-L-alanyl-D-glutamate--2, 6-diaminopimelate ligase n=1 Tax=Lactobacillus sp. 3B(2020) TaxID=2695882 RepID=UPI0015DF0B5A|nr:UDP-N-acetylmuramoyl-L-alanyl-D-glutamate--2,6-diaminopimelate ligase [Lactobacillus sp. 3B(2020)]QLL70269.1 UDP-N-acetylmuramoyl-L-alanyl-D-glutamate--2,6-diaminopimelate ligase [Lactobacillus sp. 3B(2020)]
MLAKQLIMPLKYCRLDPVNFTDFEVTELTQDTRKVRPGAVFVAIKGSRIDGHRLIGQAIAKGARLIVAQEMVEANVPVVYVHDTHRALAELAANFYGQPSRRLQVIGVTGTNGKTTVTHLIEKIFRDQDQLTGLIGTLYQKIGQQTFPTVNTTPDALTIQRRLREMVDEKVQTVAMEVSSIALVQERVRTIDFKVAVFTNFSEDHLAYHHTMAQYKLAKSLLFSQLGPDKVAVINQDDPVGREFAAYTPAQVLTYGLAPTADFRAEQLHLSMHGVEFKLVAFNQTYAVTVPLVGQFNVYNCLAAIATAFASGIAIQDAINSLKNAHGVKGRFQLVPTTTGITVIVDYAHTPDGLKKVMETLNQFAQRKVYCVIGCGGDRDAPKRPMMAQIATTNSSQTIFTMDNPRNEDPHQIMAAMLKGVSNNQRQPLVIYDREQAIQKAIRLAQPGDVVLIAGKGHETYQQIGQTKYHFDDFEIASAALKTKLPTLTGIAK